MSSIQLSAGYVIDLCEAKIADIQASRLKMVVEQYNNTLWFGNVLRWLTRQKRKDKIDVYTVTASSMPPELRKFRDGLSPMNEGRFRYWMQEAHCRSIMRAAKAVPRRNLMTVDTSDYGWIS